MTYCRIMFLGGKLDHTIREVKQHPQSVGMPTLDTYTVPAPRRAAPTVVDHLNDAEEAKEQVYELHMVEAGAHPPYWVYILRGYAPPRLHVLDACPIVHF